MQITIEETAVNQKTKELCQAILDQPEMPSIRQRVDAFMNDEKTRELYDNLMAKGQELQQKQNMALQLTDQEIADFEKHREQLMNNTVARGFMDAQEELHQVQESIQKYVSKTLELGHVPTDEEMNDGGGCGHGCGCKH
jgi:cell fate (sporulation/competence/biofilm development) regulator YlbF (YheA/YmcA/DUF963 family)